MAASLRDLEAKLDGLFEYLVHIITESLSLKTSSMLIAAWPVTFYNPGNNKTLQRWVQEELDSILNIKKRFRATGRSKMEHGVSLTLQSFDAKS